MKKRQEPTHRYDLDTYRIYLENLIPVAQKFEKFIKANPNGKYVTQEIIWDLCRLRSSIKDDEDGYLVLIDELGDPPRIPEWSIAEDITQMLASPGALDGGEYPYGQHIAFLDQIIERTQCWICVQELENTKAHGSRNYEAIGLVPSTTVNNLKVHLERLLDIARWHTHQATEQTRELQTIVEMEQAYPENATEDFYTETLPEAITEHNRRFDGIQCTIECIFREIEAFGSHPVEKRYDDDEDDDLEFLENIQININEDLKKLEKTFDELGETMRSTLWPDGLPEDDVRDNTVVGDLVRNVRYFLGI